MSSFHWKKNILHIDLVELLTLFYVEVLQKLDKNQNWGGGI